METYLVGGAVRDKLLNYPYHENDWVVVGATPKTLLDLNYKQVGKDFPVFLHPETKEEYALARTERKIAGGYHGFDIDTSKDITLEEDLIRRDLTINAIAETPNGDIIDPFHGVEDIKTKQLRHVSGAFSEDPVRILRVARFYARYAHLGFSIAQETRELMKKMVANGEVNHLVAERVWQEFDKALGEKNPELFISSLRDCGALAVLMPEIDMLFGVIQPPKYHPEVDTGIHTLMTLEQAAKISKKKTIRFSALTHDIGKGLTPKDMLPSHRGHETRGLDSLNTMCERLRVPNDYRTLANRVMEFHTHCHRAFEMKPSTVLKLFQQLDAFRNPETLEDFLLCCEADAKGRTGLENNPYPQTDHLRELFAAAKTITAKQFIEQGIQGKQIGEAIQQAQIQEIEKVRNSVNKPNAI